MRLSLALLACFALTGPAQAAEVTFNQQIAPLLFANCTVCHRPNEVAPFSLLTYQDAKKRAKQMSQVVSARTMPPWKPEQGFGDFLHSRRLSDSQVKLFQAWIDGGLLEGSPSDLPPLPKFKEGWQLGTPDLILKMPKPAKIPAEGDDIYLHIVFPLEFEKERYLKGIEVLPGNRKVAHHAVGILDTSGTARKLNAKAGGSGYARFGGPGFLPAGFTPGYVPGQTPRFFDAETAITLKKGTDLVLQMHYHPTGKEETDQTSVGLYFTDKKPARNMALMLLGSEDIDIAPGKADYTVRDEFKVPCEFEVRSIWAHMHMLGKKVHVWAELPDGKKRELLKIEDWDFNWQDTYQYQKSFKLPKNTLVKADFVFDNSAKNPRNPFSPPKRVTLGENSTDEMAGLIIGGLPPNPWDELALWPAVIGHYFEIAGKGFNAKKR
jgi:hypothetical protein